MILPVCKKSNVKIKLCQLFKWKSGNKSEQESAQYTMVSCLFETQNPSWDDDLSY